jgi:hypothetical protein
MHPSFRKRVPTVPIVQAVQVVDQKPAGIDNIGFETDGAV